MHKILSVCKMGSHFPSSNYSLSDAQSTAQTPMLYILSLFVFSCGNASLLVQFLNYSPWQCKHTIPEYQRLLPATVCSPNVDGNCDHSAHAPCLSSVQDEKELPHSLWHAAAWQIKRKKKTKQPRWIKSMSPKTSLWVDRLLRHLPGEITTRK